MTIFYRLGSKLYVNITNQCSCQCIFCIRTLTDGVGDADSLWLPAEPSVDEIMAAFYARHDIDWKSEAPVERGIAGQNCKGGCDADPYDTNADEIIFCGYGEPMERADDVITIARYIKEKTDLPIRINTNGLVRLKYPDFDIQQLTCVDSVSISLNADDPDEYVRVTRPQYGAIAYQEVLTFASQAKDYTQVIFTVVNTIEPHRIDNCRRIAESLGIPLRVRGFM